MLVVDDEEAIRDLLVKMLELADYEVDGAPDGPSALEFLQKEPCDLMFVDLKMPGMDGLALIRQARSSKPGLPVIVVTGYSSEASASCDWVPRARPSPATRGRKSSALACPERARNWVT